MIVTENDITTITCDKCKKSSSASKDDYNNVFFKDGWVLNRGRKYMHLCYDCLTPESKRARDFVIEKFMNHA